MLLYNIWSPYTIVTWTSLTFLLLRKLRGNSLIRPAESTRGWFIVNRSCTCNRTCAILAGGTLCTSHGKHVFKKYIQGFLMCFRDPIRVPRIENRVPRIRENYIRGNIWTDTAINIFRISTGPYWVPNIFQKTDIFKRISKYKFVFSCQMN